MGDFRGPTPRAVLRRRAIAISLVVLATAGLALLLFGSDDGQDEPGEGGLDSGLSGPVAELVASLSREELVDQVLLLGFDGADASTPFLAEVRARQLGGILIGPQNWTDSASGTELIGELRASGRRDGRIPPLIATSQEGGPYRALIDLPPEETQLAIGDGGSIAAAEDWALRTSQGLAAAGVDLNLFPVADVATLDSPVADRAFSDDPAAAAALTAAAVRACRAAEIACAALHFPGLGAASQDTSRGPATVGLDPAALAGRDLESFRAAFAERIPAVVLSLAFYAAYDPVTPGALAEPVTTGLLRDELGFKGVAITDDLGAGAVRSSYAPPKAAVRALAAGADLLQIGSPADQDGVREQIVAALESGQLPADRLEQAAGRILELKRDQGILDVR